MNNQTNLDGVGISDHAVAQFQARIAQLDDVAARRIIRDGIQQAANIRVLPDGNTFRLRTRRPFPFEFRAYCVFDQARGHFVVTTVVRGDSSVTRKHRQKALRSKERQNLQCGDQSPLFESADKSTHSIGNETRI